MASHYQDVAATPIAVSSHSALVRGLWARALDQLQAAVCALHGHDQMLHFERGRMFLRCSSCGYESPGWDTGGHRPQPRFAGDATRHQIHGRPARSESVS